MTKQALEHAAQAARLAWAGDRVCPWEDLAEFSKREYRKLAQAVIDATSEKEAPS